MSFFSVNKKEAISIFWAVMIALFIRIAIFEPYSIPSGSMKPNFLVGDYLFVSKYHYGISNASFPFNPPLFSGRVLAFNQPQRGEVIVFKSQHERGKNYIKRLIGLPGDEVQLINGIVYINNKMVEREEAGIFTDTDGHVLKRYRETLPNGKSYEILEDSPFGSLDNTRVFKVPEGHYFFLGDNRDHSADSRTAGNPIGYVPYEDLIGRAEMIIFSNPSSMFEIWKWPFTFNLSRYFEKVGSQ